MGFQKGNKLGGRPPGRKNKATMLAQELLDGEAEKITRKCISEAKKGNPVALKLCMERLIPPRKILELEGEGLKTVSDDNLKARLIALLGISESGTNNRSDRDSDGT